MSDDIRPHDSGSATPDPPATGRNPFPWPGERILPWLGTSVAAMGGVMVTLGATVLGGDWGNGDDGFNQAPGIATSVAVLVVALVLARRLPGAARGAPIGAAATAVPALMGFLTLGDEPTYDSFRMFQLLTIAGWVLLFFVGTLRARAVFLGLALALTWNFAVLEASNIDDSFGVDPFVTGVPFLYPPDDEFSGDLGGTEFSGDPTDYDGDGLSDDIDPTPFGDDFGEFDDGTFDERDFDEPGDRRLPVALTSSVFGVVYLLAMRRLDRSGELAVGTAFAATGGIALVSGVVTWGTFLESTGGGGFFAVVVGLFIAWCGAGGRRFTTFLGALTASVGALFVAGDATDGDGGSDGSVSWFGTLTILFGIALTVVATGLARILREPGAGPPLVLGRQMPPDAGTSDGGDVDGADGNPPPIDMA